MTVLKVEGKLRIDGVYGLNSSVPQSKQVRGVFIVGGIIVTHVLIFILIVLAKEGSHNETNEIKFRSFFSNAYAVLEGRISSSFATNSSPKLYSISSDSQSSSILVYPKPHVTKHPPKDIRSLQVSSQIMTQPTTIFYAVGDTPYSNNDAIRLRTQIQNIPHDADFVIHVGDLFQNRSCSREVYTRAASILKLSPVPVFVILGDNDWNDCINPEAGLQIWREEFLRFDERHWDLTPENRHPLGVTITRQLNRTENFSFVHKGTLFIGLNLVDGNVLNPTEWFTRLHEQYNWTVFLIRQYIRRLLRATKSTSGRIVIFGHSDITPKHDAYFVPLRNFIFQELKNSIPILYLHGDIHHWLYEPNCFNQPSMLRVALEGMTKQLPLKVMVHATGLPLPTQAAFVFDRRL